MAHRYGYTDGGTRAAVGAAVATGVFGCKQIDLVVSNQRDVFACRNVAALHQDVAVFAGTGGDEADVAAGLKVAATAGAAQKVDATGIGVAVAVLRLPRTLKNHALL